MINVVTLSFLIYLLFNRCRRYVQRPGDATEGSVWWHCGTEQAYGYIFRGHY